MKKHEIILTLEGLPEDDGHVRVTDFINEIRSFVHFVNETDNLVTGSGRPSFYLRVVGLSHGSPAIVAMEALPRDEENDQRAEVFTRTFGIFEDIKGQKNLGFVDYGQLEALKNFVAPIGNRIATASVSLDSKVIDITQELKAKINLELAAEDTYPGEFRGMLEYLNVHGNQRVFRIYPDIGPSKVSCNFSESHKDNAIKAIDRFVEVRGTVTQKKAAYYPHEIDVEEITVLPSEDELPTLYDLRGMAPKATGEMMSEEFVRSIRDARE